MKKTKETNLKLSNEAQILILNESISKIINIFLDTFLAAYFYKISQQNIYYLSLYNIIGWLIATIGAFVVGNYIKRKNKVNLYRFGIFVKSVYIFMIIILKEKIVDYVYVIGIMFGFTTATTGFPYNMIKSEQISNSERSKFTGYTSSATEIIGLIVPILLGAYITIKSYEVTAILILIFSLLQLLLSFFIENKNIQNSRMDLKGFNRILKKDDVLKKLYFIEFLKGITRYGVMSLIVSLLIIYQTNNDLEVGGFTAFFSLFTVISMYLFGKYYNIKFKKQTLIICAIAMLISFCFVIVKINIITIIIYNITYYVFMNILLNITEIDLFDYSNNNIFKDKYNTEYFIFRELFLNIGRIIGYLALLVLVGMTQNFSLLKVLFLIIAISIMIIINMSKKISLKNE